jgi:hypothetical protein
MTFPYRRIYVKNVMDDSSVRYVIVSDRVIVLRFLEYVWYGIFWPQMGEN